MGIQRVRKEILAVAMCGDCKRNSIHKERSGKQNFKLEGRGLASLNASPERKGIM